MLDIVLKLLYFYNKMDHPDPVEVKKLKARECQRKRREINREFRNIWKKDATQQQKNWDAKRLTTTEGKEETSRSWETETAKA